MPVVCPKRIVLSLGIAALMAPPAIAEIPPQYTTWQNFAAITAQRDIPEKLGIVDRIERTADGFRIYGGNCWIDATVVRKAPASPDGKPMVGPSRVSGVNLGEKTCK